MTETEAKLITGGLSHPSKMPCPAFSLPASACKTGAKLASKEGTVCSKCYAKKGNYTSFAHIKTALEKRLDLLEYWAENDPGEWVAAMTTLIGNHRYFRWHDSGDVQGETHLDMIEAVARALPETRFWLPTHEVWVAKRAHGRPDNLLVRLSAAKVDGPPSSWAAHTGTVSRNKPPQGTSCPAPSQGNQCGTCRQCWSPDVGNVDYHLH